MFSREMTLRAFHNGSYRQVVSDLDAAWLASRDEAERQLSENEAPWALVECLRIALLESGMRAWATTREPSIVVRAVATGLWTRERARSLAELIFVHPDEPRRARYLDILEGRREPTTVPHAQALSHGIPQLLDAACALESDEDRSDALSFLIPYLPPGWDRRVVDSVMTVSSDIGWRNPILERLSQRLNGELLHKALTGAFDHENGRILHTQLLWLSRRVDDPTVEYDLFCHILLRILTARHIYQFRLMTEAVDDFSRPSALRALRRYSREFMALYERLRYAIPYSNPHLASLHRELLPFVEYLQSPARLPVAGLEAKTAIGHDPTGDRADNRRQLLDWLDSARKWPRGDLVEDLDLSTCQFPPEICRALAFALVEADKDGLGSYFAFATLHSDREARRDQSS